jgi:pilus assembly protein CpaB
MKLKPRVLMSLLLAIVAMILVYVYLNTRETELLESSNPKDVIIATDDILPSVPIEENQVKLAQVPKKWVQTGAVSDLKQVVGTISRVPIMKSSQVLGTELISYDKGTGLAFKVPVGKRAVTIAVNDVSGVANLVQPGNYVDIVGLFKFGTFPANAQVTPISVAPNQQSQALTLFQNVLVLATGQDTGETITLNQDQREKAKQRLEQYGQTGVPARPEAPPRFMTVTVAMTPENAQDIIFAQNAGDLTLVLRSFREKDTLVELKNSTAFTVLKVDMPVVPRHGPSWREIRGQ